jgi:secernin
MCDTVVRVEPGRVLFAKNSDRDPNEAQLLDWQPAGSHAPGGILRCTWISVPQVPETHAVLLSRPFWMWGAEIGANDAGVTIGNEAVFTNQPYAGSGLTGMDLLRLGLERAASAEAAVAVITELLETHGQGGGCGHEDRGFTYHNSFLVADASGAFVLETADRHWAVERVEQGARSISNGLTLEPFASRYADRIRGRVAACGRRQERTQALAQSAAGPADMMAILRDHGEAAGFTPAYSRLNGAMGSPCVHAGGMVANSQTTASWVAELREGSARHWATASAAPCCGLFKPVQVVAPVAMGAEPTDRFDAGCPWWLWERLHRRVARDPGRLLPLYADERDALEADWLRAPPESGAAFAEAERRRRSWERRVVEAAGDDARPGWTRRYWRTRNERAGLTVDAHAGRAA